MPRGWLLLVGMLSWPDCPVGRMLPILLPDTCVYQTRALGSTKIPHGWLVGVAMSYSWKTPFGFTLVTLVAAVSVNQTLPDGATASMEGWAPEVGTPHSLMADCAAADAAMAPTSATRARTAKRLGRHSNRSLLLTVRTPFASCLGHRRSHTDNNARARRTFP